MKIAILGYGNLGKALEKAIENDNEMQLTAIFSRRKSDMKKYVDAVDIQNYAGQIDCLAVALGSYEDTLPFMSQIGGMFNTVDSFDNHKLIEKYKSALDKSAKDCRKTSVISVGWDPGIMSLVRAMFSAYPNERTAVFWGKGISQGHSNAIRTLKGVTDAVQYTVPDETVVSQALKGNIAETDFAATHKRICYVSAEGDKHEIEHSIKSMPDYFAPYRTEVIFTSKEEIARMKKDMSHKGVVATSNSVANMTFTLNAYSNPDITAHTMLAYAKAAVKLNAQGVYGALDCLDIPLRYIANNSMI
ncbi:MAG: diaminopimelate dehydrogenase [Corallococcus sp.]|nr:diaminopimelate dehydrogenase [Corallococcus sp.]